MAETHLRVQLEAALKENKQLKGSLEKLERENYDLKRSVYELSLKLNEGRNGENGSVFRMNDLLMKEGTTSGDVGTYLDAVPVQEDDEQRILYEKSELRGHGGAVYTTKFSPCGRFLASGSLDRRVLLWDITTKFNQHQLASLAHHNQLVIDMSWSNDSRALLSASYDHTVNLWDTDKGQLINSVGVNGLVQTVSFNPADNDMYFIGTSQKELHMLDVRSGLTNSWAHDAMVNSLYVTPNGQQIITGDSKGWVKTWDVRTGSVIDDLSQLNDDGHHAISHVHGSPAGNGRQGDEEGRYLAVNSYDNILRIYDRGSKLISNSQDPMQLSCFVTGHKNKNWPIKSSFFRGEGNNYKLSLNRFPPRKLTDGDNEELTYQERELQETPDELMLLATGSADNKIYLHDVRRQQSLVQRLDAHSDRVYAVDFHPKEPILASASADFTVKIFLPRRKALMIKHHAEIQRGRPHAMERMAKRIVLSKLQSGREDVYMSQQSSVIVPPFHIAYSRVKMDGKLLAVADEEGVLSFYKTQQEVKREKIDKIHRRDQHGNPIARIVAHENAIFDMIWCNRDEYIATASGDQRIGLWDVETGRQIYNLPGHSMSVKCIRQHPMQPNVFASGSRDGNIFLWDVRLPPIAIDVPGQSPFPRTLRPFSGCNRCHDYQVVADKRKKRRVSLSNAQRSVTCIEFNGDGTQMISAGA
ncbi:hypothetical protein THRCLA_06234, partial [Thraustotheca clavata]